MFSVALVSCYTGVRIMRNVIGLLQDLPLCRLVGYTSIFFFLKQKTCQAGGRWDMLEVGRAGGSFKPISE